MSWGRQYSTLYPEGIDEPISLHGYYSQIFRKQADGAWKRLAFHYRVFPADKPEDPEITENDKEQIRLLLERWEKIALEYDDPDEMVVQLEGRYADQAFYINFEPYDWASILTFQSTIAEAQPDIFDRPWNWQAHSDNILSEIPIE